MTIDYTLAKELKEAGFPQFGSGQWQHVNGGRTFDEEIVRDFPSFYAYAPTLEELIEACGKSFDSLRKRSTFFEAVSYSKETSIMTVRGKTPTEAVARLWLALQEHNSADV